MHRSPRMAVAVLNRHVQPPGRVERPLRLQPSLSAMCRRGCSCTEHDVSTQPPATSGAQAIRRSKLCRQVVLQLLATYIVCHDKIGDVAGLVIVAPYNGTIKDYLRARRPPDLDPRT